tara:strand:+ start:985 stop:1353 length:369 start_codon:yes stop_codon:yes gene_type:complete
MFPKKLLEQFREWNVAPPIASRGLNGLEGNKMKTSTAVIGGLAAIVVIAIGVYMVDIDQTEEGRLPSVDVSVEGGNLPEFEAKTGSVNVTKEEVDVTVPKVEVTTEEKTVTVPGVSITPPSE